jgi:hypothetical protein
METSMELVNSILLSALVAVAPLCAMQESAAPQPSQPKTETSWKSYIKPAVLITLGTACLIVLYKKYGAIRAEETRQAEVAIWARVQKINAQKPEGLLQHLAILQDLAAEAKH